jgi:hypothetical protein
MKRIAVHSSVGRPVKITLRGPSNQKINGICGHVARFSPDIEDDKMQDYFIVDDNGKSVGWFAKKEFVYTDAE